ncbi:MAG: hypothetical protein K8R69_12405 [Deltaproteobacteria bacterium]|nr:hypothetical protein [Deltaproteobacteria bacterium]
MASLLATTGVPLPELSPDLLPDSLEFPATFSPALGAPMEELEFGRAPFGGRLAAIGAGFATALDAATAGAETTGADLTVAAAAGSDAGLAAPELLDISAPLLEFPFPASNAGEGPNTARGSSGVAKDVGAVPKDFGGLKEFRGKNGGSRTRFDAAKDSSRV